MRRLYHALPGTTPFKVVTMAVIIAGILALVILSYEWLGDFLDSGGTLE